MPSAHVDIDHIFSLLTLEEKVSLTSAEDWWRTPIIRRDGRILVPHIKTTDGPNGARGESYVSGIKSACFPCSTCIGATFDIGIAFRAGREIALEAKTKSADVLLAPTVNAIRSPLGGRNHETFSEDPHVLGVMGASYINGCQSVGIAATAKHFVANDIEKRRRFLTAEIDERTLREIYLYPFQLIRNFSDPWCFMTSYNRVNGTYVASDPRLIQKILREEWGFKGLVMSDWVGTYSTVEAINAGLDLEMPGPTKFRGPKLLEAVKEDKVDEATIDISARRVLELIIKTRRFDDPDDKIEFYAENPERDEFIAKAAAEGAVLLKNNGNLLPIPKDATVVVIGQHAHIPTVGGGGSAKVDAGRLISPLEGLKAAGVNFTYEPGVPVFGAVPLPKSARVSPTGSKVEDTAKPIKLEWFNGSKIGQNLVRECYIERTEYMIKERWPSNLNAEYSTRMTFNLTPKTFGNHLFSVLTTGPATLYIDNKEVFHRPQEQHLQREAFYFFGAKFERRFNFSMNAGQTYTLRLESWATESEALKSCIGGAVIQGSGVRFFESMDVPAQIERAAVAASKADVAVVFVGTTAEFESEGYDRETMDLTSEQYELITAVSAKNPETVVVNYSGSPVSMTQFVDKAAAIVQCWFPGQECGHSIAKILAGEVNPSGRLPMTWPKRIEDHACFGNWPTDDDDVIRYEEGVFVGYRHYDLPGAREPLFPFGFGLSYTTFSVSDVQISGKISSQEEKVDVSCVMQNTGKRKGKVVLQFYVQPQSDGPVSRPVKELKAFKKQELEAGSNEKVSVELDKYAVSFYDVEEDCWSALKGVYKVLVGFSAAEIVGSVNLEVQESFLWKGL